MTQCSRLFFLKASSNLSLVMIASPQMLAAVPTKPRGSSCTVSIVGSRKVLQTISGLMVKVTSTVTSSSLKPVRCCQASEPRSGANGIQQSRTDIPVIPSIPVKSPNFSLIISRSAIVVPEITLSLSIEVGTKNLTSM